MKNRFLACIDYVLGVPLLLLASLLREFSNMFWRPLIRFLWNFSNSRPRSTRPRILIVKLSGVDHGVSMLASFYLLKKQFPNCHLTFLGSQSLASFFSKTKIFDRIETYSFTTYLEMRRAHYMMVLDYGIKTKFTALLCAFLKTPLCIGFKVSKSGRHFAFDEARLFKSSTAPSKNYWLLAKEAVQACGHQTNSDFNSDQLEVFEKLKPIMLENASKNIQFNLPKHYIVFNLSATESQSARLLEESQWLSIMKKIKSEQPEMEFMLIGHGLAQNTDMLIAEGAKPWIDRLSYDELFQVLHSAKEIYTIDNELTELCLFFNKQCNLFLGPTSEIKFENFKPTKILKSPLACSPCVKACQDPVCMKAIEH